MVAALPDTSHRAAADAPAWPIASARLPACLLALVWWCGTGSGFIDWARSVPWLVLGAIATLEFGAVMYPSARASLAQRLVSTALLGIALERLSSPWVEPLLHSRSGGLIQGLSWCEPPSIADWSVLLLHLVVACLVVHVLPSRLVARAQPLLSLAAIAWLALAA